MEIDVVGKGNKVYIHLHGEALNKAGMGLSQLKENWELEKGLDNFLNIEIKSINGLERFKELLLTK